jgi:OFA family oxalate/formate antiporter-like MFS transporter
MTNRWVQLGASVVAMIMIANLQYAWTMFVLPIQKATGWALSDLQWGFTLFIIFETWVMPFEGWMIDRFGPRIFLSVAGVLCGIGWTALAYVTTLPQLYFFYSMAGVGAAFVYSGSIATALKWFPDKRGLASGIIAAGFGSGSALFIPVIAYLIREQSYQQAFLWTGVLQGIVIIAAAQLLRHPDHQTAGAKAAAAAVVPNPKIRRNTEQFNTGEMLRTPHFYALYIMFVMMATGGLLVTAQAGPLAREWNISLAALTAALALDRIANGSGRVFWGWVSDKIGREKTMAIAFILQSACLVSVLLFGRVSGLLFTVTLVLTLFTWGEIYVLFPSILGDWFGTRHATSNYSFLYTAKGVASILGGGLAAVLFQQFGSWSAAFYGSATLALIAGLMALGLRVAPLPKKVVDAAPRRESPVPV